MVLDYNDKLILAPMVRAGTLPLRLLALRYGADIVYTEEIIAKKMLTCRRVENHVLNTIDFVCETEKKPVLRTCSLDHPVSFQMGTADAVTALKAATMVYRDVDAIDVNMCCPIHFSISGGMGAALLSKPEVAKDILSTLVRNLPSDIPVTCKIRLLPSIQETLDFARVVEGTGIRALAIHARRVPERRRDNPHWDEVASIVSANLSIPVIHNSDVYTYADILRAKEVTGAFAYVILSFHVYFQVPVPVHSTGANSVMIARGALANASIFRPEGMLPQFEVAQEYVKMAVQYDNVFQNTKWFLTNMLRTMMKEPFGQRITKAKTTEEFCDLFDIQDYYQETLRLRNFDKQVPAKHNLMAKLSEEMVLKKQKCEE